MEKAERNRWDKAGTCNKARLQNLHPDLEAQPMTLDRIEQCLQDAAAASSVWAVIREANVPQWLIVLQDESILDVEFDAGSQTLILGSELGLVRDKEQRNTLNDLVLRCHGVLPMPQISLTNGGLYELTTRWPIDLDAANALAIVLDNITAQVQLWREVVNRPTPGEKPDVAAASMIPFNQLA